MGALDKGCLNICRFARAGDKSHAVCNAFGLFIGVPF